MIIPEKREKRMVYRKVMEVFLTEEIFNTKNRTGILIFVSYLEKKVVILADSGINEKTTASQWEQIVDKMTNSIKKGKIELAYIDAITNCEKLLLEKGFNTESQNKNELSDNFRVE